MKLPDEPSITDRTKIALLNKRSGGNFDHAYVKVVGVSAHEDAVVLFKKASMQAKDPGVQSFAAATLPKLAHHREMVQTLEACTGKLSAR